ncbi:MAG TPA: hypothetical protein VFS90_08100 [Pyrinomonadaceae bacterium]|nr:hypothetical protein [Pyrinomonadaceae bacterium]
MKRIILFLIAVAAFTISSDQVFACQCDDYHVPICGRYWRSDVVFVGQVRDITPIESRSPQELPLATVHFIVEQPFRGVTTATIDVQTMWGTMCDIRFVKGKRYLVFGARDSETNQLGTGMCSGTRAVEDSEDALNYIRSVMQGAASESIKGSIEQMMYKEIAGAKVEIRNGKTSFETTSDEKGKFSVSVGSPGTYTVRVLIPSSVIVAETIDNRVDKIETTDTLTTIEYKVELGKNECDYRRLELFPVDLHATAAISGNVLTASGRPVDKGDVYLQSADAPDWSRYTKIEADGSFKFEEVAVGEYFLVLNPDNKAPGEDDPPFARAYYPNATNTAAATKVVVTEGAKLENLTLRVGPPLKARVVSGRIVWKDGSRATDGSLSVYDGDHYVRLVNADKKGFFSFKVYGDFKYTLKAQMFGEPLGESDRVPITDKSTNLTLVLKPK